MASLKDYVKKSLVLLVLVAGIGLAALKSDLVMKPVLYCLGLVPSVAKWLGGAFCAYLVLIFFVQNKIIYITYSISPENDSHG